jgi:hypothetical protein
MTELDSSSVNPSTPGTAATSSEALAATSSQAPAATSSHAPEVLPRPERALKALDDLRQRVRRLFWIDGLVMFGLAVGGSFTISFVLDYFLHLPRVVRVVLLVGMLLYWVSVIVRRIVRPGRVPLALDDLALLVEDQNPELRQSLVTAVQLSESKNRSARYLSADLIGSLVQDVEKALSTVSFSRVLNTKKLNRCMLGLVVLFVSLAYSSFSQPDLAGRWASRVLLLSAEPWPRSVELALVRPLDNPTTVALGESLLVEVDLHKGEPDEVAVVFWTEDGGRRRDMMRAAPEGDYLRYRKVFENINESFSFQVSGGDHELEEVNVRVLFRPRVSRLAVWCEYPEYTGKESTPAETPILNGHLRVPERTKVRYRAVSDVPVELSHFEFVDSENLLRRKGGDDEVQETTWPPSDSRALSVVSLDDQPDFLPEFLPDGTPVDPLSATGARPFVGSGFEGEFEVVTAGNYRFHLQGTNGLINERPVHFRVKMIRDQKPVVRFEEPRRPREEVSTEAVVPLKLAVRDDYGIKSAEILGVLFRNGVEGGETAGDAIRLTLDEIGAEESSQSKKKSLVERVLDIAKLGAQEDSRLRFYARATDFGGNVGESERYELRIVSKDFIVKNLHDQLMIMKDQLHGVIRHQQSARRDVESFQDEAMLKEKIDKSHAGKLSSLRQNQSRVTRGISHAVDEINRILGKMESNRVGEEKDKKWIEKMRDQIDELGKKNSRGIEDAIQNLKTQVAEAPQDPAALQPVRDGQKVIERQLDKIASDLTEFGDINAILQQWREILRREIEIRDRIHGRVHGRVREASGDGK